jgi:GntR family transcriptional regulator/MocR family aminotransferase
MVTSNIIESGPAPSTNQHAISVDHASKIPLYVQLHEAIAKRIENGSFPAGHRLPGQRQLASALKVSRNTIRHAFQDLVSDGLIEGDPTSGFVVRTHAPASAPNADIERPRIRAERSAFQRSAAIEQIDSSRLRAPGEARPFRHSLPASDQFPLQTWEELRARLLQERAPELLHFTDAFGYMPLREALAARLQKARGVKCTAQQVIITAGGQQALNLVVNTLVSPGDVIAVEEPGSYLAKAAFLHVGARLLPLLVDEEGLIVPDARKQNGPSVIYSTPANQFPLGAILPLARRLALLDYASQNNTWIVEDDSDGDFSYSGPAMPSLQGADRHNRVIYLGTTGKSLFPSLEIGFLVVPAQVLELFSKTKEITGGQPCAIDQATLALFISEGHFDQYVQRATALYQQCFQALSESVESELKGLVQLQPPQAGLHAVGWLNRNVDEDLVTECAEKTGVELPLLSTFGKTALVRPGVVFGFASFSEAKIRQSVKALGKALRSAHKSRMRQRRRNRSFSEQLPGFFRRLFTAYR